MPLYHWQALTDAGEPRQGALAGDSEVQVIDLLRRQGLRVTRVLREQAAVELPRARSHAPELRLLRELLALRSVGLGAPAALARLAGAHPNSSFAGELALVRRAVETGQPLGEALARVPQRFDELVCRVLTAGEARGDLDGTLQRLVAHLEHARRPTAPGVSLRRLAWTTAVALILISLALGLLLPAVTTVSMRLHPEAPPGTVLRLGVAVQPVLRWFVGIIAALGLALALASRAPPLRARLDAVALHLPGLGSTLRLHASLRLTRLLAAELSLQSGQAGSILSGAGRPELLLNSQSLVRAGRAAEAIPELQVWLARHPRDASAWQLLAGACAAQGLSLRAIRAEAEAQVARLDYAAALDRFKAAQTLMRNGSSASIDHIEASIIDTRARAVQVLLREQALER